MPEQPTAAALADALERLLFFGPKPSPSLRYLESPGLTATLGAHPDPNHNRVGLTKLSSDAADAAIDRLVDRYRSAGHGLVWYVTPSSEPLDLASRLEARGLRRDHDVDLAGLALSPLPQSPLPGSVSHPHSDVRVSDFDELRRHVRVMAEAYGTPVDHSLATIERLAAGAAEGYEFVQYLSFEDDVPVAVATSMIDHERKVTLLGGGATLPAQRGRGHYRALVSARVEDARRRGSNAVVSHAIRTTSAPILLRLGFREVVGIQRFVLPAPH